MRHYTWAILAIVVTSGCDKAVPDVSALEARISTIETRLAKHEEVMQKFSEVIEAFGKMQEAQAAQAPAAPAPADTAGPDITIMKRKGPLQFGNPSTSEVMNMTYVHVEVSNTRQNTIGCMVKATFLSKGDIVGVADGAVVDVPPNSTATADMVSPKQIGSYDTLKLEASNCN